MAGLLISRYFPDQPTNIFEISGASWQATGLDICWPLVGHTQDVSGGRSHGAVTGTAVRSGTLRGEGLQLGSSTSYISTIPSLKVATKTEITLSIWARFNSFPSVYGTVISTTKSSGIGYVDLHVKSNGKLACYVCDTVGDAKNYDGTGVNTLVAGRLYHLVLTYKSSGLVGYVNGEIDGSAAASYPLNTGTYDLFQVSNNLPTFGGRYIDATVFDARMYNYALSGAQVREIYRDPWALYRKVAPVYILPSAGGGGATITPTGLSSSAFGSFSVNAGDRIISFTGKASEEAFGAFNLRAKRLVSFIGKSSDEAFGSFSVHPGKVSILLNSKTTDEAYGAHSLLSGQKVISPTAKGSDSAFGSFIIVSGDRILLINGVASNEAFGAFSINNNTASQTVIPSGYFDSSIGSLSLRPDQYIIFSGKEYLEFGQFLLSGSAVVRAMHFFDWIAQQPGLRGTLNDKLYQYLIAQGFTGSTPTMMFLWLRSLGYTGNTASMLTAFERDYTTRWY